MRPMMILAFLFVASNILAGDASLPGALEAGWQGEKVCELLHEDDMLRVLRCTFPPGVGHERHFHPSHFGYSLKGGATMRITDASGERESSGKSGGTWESTGVDWHHVVNVGETTAQYLIIEKKY